MSTRMVQRKGTFQQWFDTNPKLFSGEIGYETDTNKFKVGDGTTNWNDLAYFINQDEVTTMTQDFATEEYVDTAIDNAEVDLPAHAGTGLEWNAATSQYDVDSTIATKSYVDTAETDAIATAALDAASKAATAKSEAIAEATAQVNAVIASAPTALNTLDELAAALGDDANFAASITTALGNKQDKLASVNTTAKTSAYTLVSGDANTIIQMNGAFAFTVPLNSSVPYPIGTQIHLLALTDGASVTFTSGITSYATPGNKLRVSGSMATLIKLNTDTWVLAGDLTA
jgi:hypothetical protein